MRQTMKKTLILDLMKRNSMKSNGELRIIWPKKIKIGKIIKSKMLKLTEKRLLKPMFWFHSRKWEMLNLINSNKNMMNMKSFQTTKKKSTKKNKKKKSLCNLESNQIEKQ